MHLRWMKVFYGLVLCAISLHAMGQADIQNSQVKISLSCGTGCLWAVWPARFPLTTFPRQLFPSMESRYLRRFAVSLQLELQPISTMA